MTKTNKIRLKFATGAASREYAPLLTGEAVGEGAGVATASTRRTFPPMVVFKQLNKPMSVLVGRGVSGVLSFSLNTAVLLYPSSANTTLLAR